MATFHLRHQNRPDRKLPVVGKQNRAVPSLNPLSPSFFWLNYQSAVQWMRKNEDTISKFAQLLQVYPNLIQDSSLDAFWEFLEPLLEHQNVAEKQLTMTAPCRNRACPKHINAVTKSTSRKGVPTISVTRTSESPAPMPHITSKMARTPRVHLISCYNASVPSPTADIANANGSLTDHLLHRGVLDLLQDHFYVRKACTGYNLWNDQDANVSQLYRLSESDVCIYLFNDSTMNDANSFHDLCAAHALKIPVIFVRHHSQELPKTFAESVQLHSRGCVSLSDYIDKFVLGCAEPGKSNSDKRKIVRSKSKLAPLSVKTRSSSAGDLNIEGFNLKRGGKKQKASVSDTDILLYLINNFKTSYIFDENDPQSCARHVKLGIHRAIGITECEHLPDIDTNSPQNSKSNGDSEENDIVMSQPALDYEFRGESASFEGKNLYYNQSGHLKVPESSLLAREWSNSGAVSAPPHDNPGRHSRFTYDFNPPSSAPIEQKSTTYLIFDDKNATKKIRRIHFPLDEREETEKCWEDSDSDEFDPGGSPIQFPDIDLAREINATMDGPEFEM